MNDFMKERRAFLQRVVVSVGGVVVASALPVSMLEASPVCLAADPCGDWTLDDQWSAYPPYACRKDIEVPRTASQPAHVDGLDVLFAS